MAAISLGRGETLSEYAELNPEAAYASPSAAPEISVSSPPVGAEGASPAPAQDAVNAPSPGQGEGALSGSDPGASETADPSDGSDDRESFFYQPLTDEQKARITGISYPITESDAMLSSRRVVNVIPDGETPAISYEDLRYLNVLYYDFNGEIQTGELICHKGISQDLLEIFYELYRNEYQIEKIRLIDEYGGDDTDSMEDNNTSCFNYRLVEGTESLSKHALGCAVDINPFYNPYVVFNKDGKGETYISPAGSEDYADRSRDFPYKIDDDDLCCKLFKAHGFTWGGDWNSSKDYQHFQKVVTE